MSDYTKSTNFTTKDSLPSGNANKVVRGAELDTEFTNIASAVASKADKNNPEFTGTVVLPSTTSIGTVSATELSYVDGVTSSIQTQINTVNTNKADKTTTITAGSGLTGGGDLSANRTISIASNSMGFGTRTVSTSDPTGGTDGDIWLKV